MTRVRLRPRWTDDELAAMYVKPHDHFIYGRGHGERVLKMIELGKRAFWDVEQEPITSIADLSCGNGYVATTLARDRPNVKHIYLGDLARGYRFHGPLEQTIPQLPLVDIYVCGETLEHLDDPDLALRLMREHTRWLLLSTPVENWEDTNAEHYWSWSVEDIEAMLRAAGFQVQDYDEVDSRVWGEPYCYGIWLCY